MDPSPDEKDFFYIEDFLSIADVGRILHSRLSCIRPLFLRLVFRFFISIVLPGKTRSPPLNLQCPALIRLFDCIFVLDVFLCLSFATRQESPQTASNPSKLPTSVLRNPRFGHPIVPRACSTPASRALSSRFSPFLRILHPRFSSRTSILAFLSSRSLITNLL